MRAYKIFICIVTAFAVVFAVSACGRISEIDSAELAERLNDSVAFSEHLTEIDSSAAEKRFYLNPGDHNGITAYVGTKATCDEFAIIKTNSPDTVVKKLQGHLDTMAANYTEYRPDEALKPGNAVLAQYKDSVVLIVSGDHANAYNVYENYLKGK